MARGVVVTSVRSIHPSRAGVWAEHRSASAQPGPAVLPRLVGPGLFASARRSIVAEPSGRFCGAAGVRTVAGHRFAHQSTPPDLLWTHAASVLVSERLLGIGSHTSRLPRLQPRRGTGCVRTGRSAWDPGGVEWLLYSLIASIVLTVVLNVAIRLWPGGAQRTVDRTAQWADRQPSANLGREGQVRVIAPWKLMIIGSIVLTVVLNLAIRLF